MTAVFVEAAGFSRSRLQQVLDEEDEEEEEEEALDSRQSQVKSLASDMPNTAGSSYESGSRSLQKTV